MEASTAGDPFATPPAADDPFAEAPPAHVPTMEEEDAAAERAATVEPPIVNREGQPVAEPVAEPEPEIEPPATAGPPATVEEPETAPEPPQAPEPEVPAPEETPQPPQEPPAPPEEPATAQPAPASHPPEQAPEEPRTGPRGGKGEMRYYKVLLQTSPDGWTEVPLTDDKGKPRENCVIVDGTPWVEARNNEHALRIGWILVDRPESGATLFPVPLGAWKPKRLKAAPPKPERERLVIG